LSAWTSNTNDLGDLSVSATAALIGSQGMQAVIDDTANIYVTDDSPTADRYRRATDPNSSPWPAECKHLSSTVLWHSTAVLRMESAISPGLTRSDAG
jgi:hypothetical protein